MGNPMKPSALRIGLIVAALLAPSAANANLFGKKTPPVDFSAAFPPPPPAAP